MSAPIQLYGPYRKRGSRLRRALARHAARLATRQWVAAWLELAALAIVLGALVAGLPFLAGVVSAYLPTL